MSYIGRQLNNLSDRVKLDSITASATATYNLLLNGVAYVPSSAESLTVVLNGIQQSPNSSYTVSGSTITFASTLSASDSIDFILAERSITLQTPSSGSVNTEQLASGSVTAPKLSSTAVDNTNTNSTLITAQTEKTTLADADKFLISDSAASGALKYVQKSNLPSGGLVHLNTTTGSSNVSIVSVDNVFSATYENYLVIFDLTLDTTGADPHFNFRDSTPQNLAASVYTQAVNGLSSDNSAISVYNSSADTKIQVGHGMYNQSSIDMPAMTGFCYILDPVGTSTTTNILWNYGQRASNGLHRGFQGASLFNNKTSVRGFSWTASSGNVHNYTFRTYGIVNS